MSTVYKDKNGEIISAGDTITCTETSERSVVERCGSDDLGIACNDTECYPLSEFASYENVLSAWVLTRKA